MKLFRSLTFKMVSSILLIFLVLLLLIFYNTFYTRKLIRTQLIDSEKQIASLYMEKIDSILTNMDHLLLSMTTDWIDDGTLSVAKSHQPLAYSRMLQQMNKQMAANEIIRFSYIYNTASGDFLYSANTGFNPASPDTIRDFISDDPFVREPGAFAQISTWKRINMNGQSLIYQSTSFQSYFIGILLDINYIFDSNDFSQYTSAHSIPIFSTITGIPLNGEDYLSENNIELNWDFSDYYVTGQNVSTIVTGVRSLSGDFGLMLLIPDKPEIFSSAYIKDFLVLIFCSIFSYIIVILFMMRRFTLKPMKCLSNAMVCVSGGNLDVKVPETSTSDDFRLVNRTFNQMLEQIRTLKIEAYEKKLELKNVEIEQLKMQINPHLFLNSLNLIYRLEKDQSPHVLEATLALIQCFRYFVRQKDPLVTLKKELEYTGSYRQIQELTYPGKISFEREIPFFLEELFVPPMTILEFVENSIKYALPFTQSLKIRVMAALQDKDDSSYLVIDIEDNGPGFDEEVLALLKTSQVIIDKQNKRHIGIMNYTRRIQNLYEGMASVEFENLSPQGAHVRIKLPLN